MTVARDSTAIRYPLTQSLADNVAVVGETLSHYRIVERLGSGGMGEVYRAEDLRLRRLVALKTLRDTAVGEQGAARLLAEARAASALNHPNIATVYEASEVEHEGRSVNFIAMEHVDGTTLHALLDQGPIDLDQILDIVGQTADALADAHDHGLVHRDIKPSNVMVTAAGRVKVLDFGVAHRRAGGVLLSADDSTHTAEWGEGASGFVGTLPYIAPEQATGRDIDGRADMFSLGVVLYELTCGAPPFGGENAMQTLDAILRAEVPPFPDVDRDPRLPQIELIVRRMLARDREGRFATLWDVRDALAAIRQGVGLPEAIDPAAEAGRVAITLFRNISGNPEDDWLGAGMSETLAADVGQLEGITVVSRARVSDVLRTLGPGGGSGSSGGGGIGGGGGGGAGGGGLSTGIGMGSGSRGGKAAQLGEADEPSLLRAGRELRARWMITGGFQRSGDAVRVTASLTDVASGRLVRLTKVDGALSGIFTLQDRLARELSDALMAALAVAAEAAAEAEAQAAMAATAAAAAATADARAGTDAASQPATTPPPAAARGSADGAAATAAAAGQATSSPRPVSPADAASAERSDSAREISLTSPRSRAARGTSPRTTALARAAAATPGPHRGEPPSPARSGARGDEPRSAAAATRGEETGGPGTEAAATATRPDARRAGTPAPTRAGVRGDETRRADAAAFAPNASASADATATPTRRGPRQGEPLPRTEVRTGDARSADSPRDDDAAASGAARGEDASGAGADAATMAAGPGSRRGDTPSPARASVRGDDARSARDAALAPDAGASAEAATPARPGPQQGEPLPRTEVRAGDARSAADALRDDDAAAEAALARPTARRGDTPSPAGAGVRGDDARSTSVAARGEDAAGADADAAAMAAGAWPQRGEPLPQGRTEIRSGDARSAGSTPRDGNAAAEGAAARPDARRADTPSPAHAGVRGDDARFAPSGARDEDAGSGAARVSEAGVSAAASSVQGRRGRPTDTTRERERERERRPRPTPGGGRAKRPVASAVSAPLPETGIMPAYEAFSRGVLNISADTYESLDRAVWFLERAVSLDPAYARAHIELGAAYSSKAEYLSMPELRGRAAASLRRGLELLPTSLRGWRELGLLLVMMGQVSEGVAAIQRALDIDSQDASTQGAMGRALFVGYARFDEAAEWFECALERNPKAGWHAMQLAHCAALLRDFPRGERAALRAMELQEAFLSGREGLFIVGSYIRAGHLAALQGRPADAIACYQREVDFLLRTEHALRNRILVELNTRMGAAYLQLGDRHKAEATFTLALDSFERRVRLGADDPSTRYYTAAVHAMRGDAEPALAFLERAISQHRAFTTARARIEPEFDSLRNDPRFQRLVGGA